MATVGRRPLASRSLGYPHVRTTPSPMKSISRPLTSIKRARSPDIPEPATAPPKRVKSAATPLLHPPRAVDTDRREKDKRRAEREAAKENFRVKYKKAFPSFIFHFNCDIVDDTDPDVIVQLQAQIEGLGGRVEEFFSKEVTHLVTDFPTTPCDILDLGKENTTSLYKDDAHLQRSPSKPRSRAGKSQLHDSITIKKAVEFKMKIWNKTKLRSVLDRCLQPDLVATVDNYPEDVEMKTPGRPLTEISRRGDRQSLAGMLEQERRHGGISERDPSQTRHDYQYFSRNSYFVLVEDMHQELATIHALEYPIRQTRDGKERGGWPVLFCHPKARGPFVEFDEKEQKKWEKQEAADEERKHAHTRAHAKAEERRQRRLEAIQQLGHQGDLRRSVSMANLRRRASMPESGANRHERDLEGDASGNIDSANASGYMASGAYVAASGNSVGITSTTGTTSTAGSVLHAMQLPPALRGLPEVEMSRKFASRENFGSMAPPSAIPERRQGGLRKAKSTNTMRLPKRDEGSKPGYCESCRTKFEDFTTHVRGSRHSKFAADDANFASLDAVLARVARRPVKVDEDSGWDLHGLVQESDGVEQLDEDGPVAGLAYEEEEVAYSEE